MKKFFEEFKKFITRGNVLDLAVGVIIGGAFTAIVTALTTNILQPLINWVIFLVSGGSGIEGVYTFLVGSAEDLSNAVYIDWGAFIGAIINFILVALVLFCIIKAINRFDENKKKLAEDLKKGLLSKEDRKELKKRGIKLTDKNKVKSYLAEKEEMIKKAEEEKKAQEEAEKLANPTTEDLLKDIKALLEMKNK